MTLVSDLVSALSDANRVLEHLCDERRLEDDEGGCPAELLCGDPICNECGCLIMHRDSGRLALAVAGGLSE